jgi:hypothetical protein
MSFYKILQYFQYLLLVVLFASASFVFFERESMLALMPLPLLLTIQCYVIFHLFIFRYKKCTFLMKKRLKKYIGMLLLLYVLIGMYLQVSPRLANTQFASIMYLHIPIAYYFIKYIFANINTKSNSAIVVIN